MLLKRICSLGIMMLSIWVLVGAWHASAQEGGRALQEVEGSPSLVGDFADLVVMTPDGRYLYVASEETITAFSFSGGTLREVDGSPFYVVDDYYYPIDMTISPDGRYLYVAHRGFVGRSLLSPITAYLIQPTTGALVELRNSPFTTYASSGRGLNRVAMMPNGRYVYALNTDDKTIAVFRLNGNTGNLYENGVVEVGGSTYTPVDIAISPDNAYLYAANQGFVEDGQFIPLSIYRIDNRNGNLAEVRNSPYLLPAEGALGFSDIAVHPSGQYLFLLNSSARSLTVLELRNRSVPTRSATLSLDGVDFEPYALAIHPSGQRIYIASHGFLARSLLSPLMVVAFSADEEHLALELVDQIAVVSQGEGLGRLAVSMDGHFVLQTNPAMGALHIFKITE